MNADRPSGALAAGGPMDGERLGDPDAAEFDVVMADRSRHVYTATRDLRTGPDGEMLRIFSWAGRV